ncbi:GNAT family N-acetyltransferase [Pseudomonas protegens]|uniref:GNAT family N-acetyltransferase n=1 Tax=Pseudomonas protegens TaxID=380021 RepID=UPI00227F21B7|nr:GNAT family N-acetyltransferase [Pseudomonas protegens]MCY7260842.1 antimicrobial resistance protein Mig-14 [Pseudomonas protegens]
MLRFFRQWRERGWSEIDLESYQQAWHRFGGSFATHPEVVERLSHFVGITPRYLGWLVEGEVVAAIPCWGQHVALSKEVLKREGKRGLLDMGNSEIILPVAPGVTVPVRQRMAYVSQMNAEQISTLKVQPQGLALARAPEDYSKKFRYNQRREQRLLEEAGGVLLPISELSPQEQAAAYGELFQLRWNFAVPGQKGLVEVFTLLREFMSGSVVMLDSAPIAIQILYRVEAPRWVSVEYINGGVDPQSREFSPGSVLSFVNTQQEWERAKAVGKTLRYSFGRADREYKDRWCHTVPVYQV